MRSPLFPFHLSLFTFPLITTLNHTIIKRLSDQCLTSGSSSLSYTFPHATSSHHAKRGTSDRATCSNTSPARSSQLFDQLDIRRTHQSGETSFRDSLPVDCREKASSRRQDQTRGRKASISSCSCASPSDTLDKERRDSAPPNRVRGTSTSVGCCG